MTNGEIRRLLSGYAAGSLTDGERRALFEAALDDQELFDALQHEQVLKEILDDPISRRQVREALETNIAPVTPSWWVRWSTWSFAAAALAAVVVVVAVIQTNRPAALRKTQEIASLDQRRATEQRPVLPPAQLEAPAAKTIRRSDTAVNMAPRQALEKDSGTRVAKEAIADKLATAAEAAAPPPAASSLPPAEIQSAKAQPAPAQQALGQPAPISKSAEQQAQVQQSFKASDQQSFADQAQVQSATPSVRNAIREERASAAPRQALGGYAGAGGVVTSDPFRRSVLKRDQSGNYSVTVSKPFDVQKGDLIRVRIAPVMSGYVTLYQQDQAGNWKQLFPSSGQELKVTPNDSYLLPDSPIEIQGTERFRLVLTPEASQPRDAIVTEFAVVTR